MHIRPSVLVEEPSALPCPPLAASVEQTVAGADPGREALAMLPQPLHLIERVSPTQHYHFGLFERDDEPLAAALDRMARLGCERFEPASRILDVGCGLGGTASGLARIGHRVLGIDPCRAGIDYARLRTNGSGARFAACDLASVSARAEQAGAYDGITSTEVLQHFPDLGTYLAGCRALLRRGGLLVVNDLAKSEDWPWCDVPFHRRGALVAAAGAAGFELVHRVELGPAIRPTLAKLAQALEARREALVAELVARRPAVTHELDELLGHARELQRAIEAGQLTYEHVVLRLDGGPSWT